jgi:hypothetical protein
MCCKWVSVKVEQARTPFIAFNDNHAAREWVLLKRPAESLRGAPASAH